MLPLLISREQALSRGGVAKLGTNLKTKSSGAESIFEAKFTHKKISLTLHRQLMCCPTWKSAFLINL